MREKTTLIDTLRATLHVQRPSALCVAFSGGPDSTALLHALAQLPKARTRGLRALHVDHGLHADSAAWAEHCVRFCESLNVPLTAVRVAVDDTRGEGVEAAARRARRGVFAEHLRDGEWLALAQHRDDQIETVLLKLLRGAGPEGLGGMRALRPFAQGFLWRPLLDVPRAALRDYANVHELHCIDDPANTDPRFARNVLRHEVLPSLTRHWPHAGAAILHAAKLCRAAADHLEREAEAALTRLHRDAGTLDATGWLALPDALRPLAFDHWLREHALPMPADAPRHELERQIADAANDRMPRVAWHGAEVRVWDGRLHALPSLPPAPREWQAAWGGESPLALPEGCGTLIAAPCDAARAAMARFAPPLIVRLRHGGERIRPAGDAHTRELRDLFQRARIPPWLRTRCPLIFADDELIAVADWWISARGRRIFDACGMRPRWNPSARA